MPRLLSALLLLLASLLLAGCSGGGDSNGNPSTGRYLVSITVLPVAPGLPAGRTLQFIAIGNYSDGVQFNITRAVTWSSSNPTAARVDPASGLVRRSCHGHIRSPAQSESAVCCGCVSVQAVVGILLRRYGAPPGRRTADAPSHRHARWSGDGAALAHHHGISRISISITAGPQSAAGGY